MTDASFLTLAGPGEAETRVRGSRFFALAHPAGGEEQARALVARQERAHFDASHHCSAWRLRDGVWRANDAGEPSGSAGLPILAAIDGQSLVGCVVVVTRFFGGTKLGVGGLIRAYGEAATLALQCAPRRLGIPALRLRIRYGYVHTAPVMRALERAEAEQVEHGFAPAGDVGEVTLTIPAGNFQRLEELLREQTSGSVRAETLDQSVIYRSASGPGPVA